MKEAEKMELLRSILHDFQTMSRKDFEYKLIKSIDRELLNVQEKIWKD